MQKLMEIFGIGKGRKLRVGFHPYTYVRTVVMKSLLFRKEDYDKMLKMSFSGIAKFLQDSHYRNEINALAGQYSDAQLLEKAISRNLSESLRKLTRISSPQISLLIKEYLIRKDLEDVKTIIRGKFTNMAERDIAESLTNAGSLGLEFLTSMLKIESVEDILKNNGIVEFKLLQDGVKYLKEKNSLIAIENTLDKYYYSRLIEFSRRLPRQGALFRNFLLKEVEISNILTILRLMRGNIGREKLNGFLILSGDKKKDAKISKLANAGNFDEMLSTLQKSEYGELISGGISDLKSKGTLITIENELFKHLLRQTVLLGHQNPLSIDTILGYMLAKDMETRNLRILIKGKQLGLKEDFIESQLVY